MFPEMVGCAFLVEDNPHDVALFEYAARRLAFPITLRKFDDGASAIAEIASLQHASVAQLPTLYVLDLDLPDIRGTDIFTRIVDIYKARDLPPPAIIFVTNHATEQARSCLAMSDRASLRMKPSSLDGYTEILTHMYDLTNRRKTTVH